MNPGLIVHSSFDLSSSKTSGTSTIFLMHYLLKEQTSELFSKEIHSQSPTCNRDLQFSYLLWIISLLEIALVTFNVTWVLCSVCVSKSWRKKPDQCNGNLQFPAVPGGEGPLQAGARNELRLYATSPLQEEQQPGKISTVPLKSLLVC